MKIYYAALPVVICVFLYSCAGPRNIYSVSPFVSPVSMEKGAIAIEGDYFSHAPRTNYRDLEDSSGTRDNCFGFRFSRMIKERTLIFSWLDMQSQRDQYPDSIGFPDDASYNAYNGGFDSSIVSGKRYAAGAGVELFSRTYGKVVPSLAASIGFQYLRSKEAGLLLRVPYHRFYKAGQLALSLQGNVLFKLSRRFNFAWVTRLSIVNTFKAHTDYSPAEKFNSGLRDGRMNTYLCLSGLYADYKPLRKVPFYINGQFFNDVNFRYKLFADYEPGRTYVKGTGVSVGLKYIFGKN